MNHAMRSHLRIAALTGITVIAAHAVAGERCDPHWDTTMGTPGIGEGYIASFLTYDDGAGSSLFAAGSFGLPAGSGAGNIAHWNGATWEGLGGQLDNWATDMALFDGKLFVGGYFNSGGGAAGSAKLAGWDGTTWTGIDAQLESWQSSVWALETFDDGSGEALYIGGNYLNIAGIGVDHLAKWDGTEFSEVGGALGGAVPLLLKCFHVFDDGSGPALYAGGRFKTLGGVSVNHIAKWNGTAWEALGTGLAGAGVGVGAHAMATFDDGTGPALYVGGHSFTSAGGVPATRIAKWDGTQWSALGDGFNGTVDGLAVYDDGDGEALYAVGAFEASGSTPLSYIAKWDGAEWSAVVGAGLNDNAFGAFTYDDGEMETLCVGGTFTMVDGLVANRAAQYVGCPNSVYGDINGDGVVDVLDLLALLSAWGECPDCPEDLNGDGVVDVLDLLDLLSNWT